MDTDDLILRRGHQAEGIGFPQVILLGKGQGFELLWGGDAGDTGIFQLAAVEILRGAQR